MWIKLLLFSIVFFPFNTISYNADPLRRIEILFLGHNSKHHDSEKLAGILTKEYFTQGINISYTTDPNDLNDKNLSDYDGLILYANHDSISTSQEQALLNFVKNGKGFVPLHSASHCFRNSPAVIDLIGGQFSSHQFDSFPAVITKTDHPVMKNISSFTTKDETYIHKNLNNDITVLTQRVEGNRNEPYTWVREYGKGRVFYTAYGHDENTFNHPSFIQLVYNGIQWAIGDQAAARLSQLKLARLTYSDGMVPNYEKRDPAPKFQHPLSAEESLSLTQVPVGFNIQLFASEPDVVNPIFMNWDERGRLWVIETTDYPNEVTDEDAGDDRIKILEDTDGDGRADKFTIFADSLNIPTSFVFSDGGILVSMAPSFLFLKDTDGDDKADVRKELLKGWGKFDTHAQASNLRYGLDNKIWGVVGYSGFKGKQGADSIKFSNGVFKFSPDGKNLEHLATTSNNTWGLGFSEEFDVFVSTANNTHTAFLGIPTRYAAKTNAKAIAVEKLDAHYSMHVATKNLRQVDVHGGFTAAAGHSLYTARNFPKEYWNRIAFVTEPTGRIVHRNILKQNGAGFVEDGDGWNIFTSADEWAGPVQAEVGPDGALWIADWYDFIIQHNPTPSVKSSGIDAVNGKGNAYINPLRDQKRGRIYRIAYNKNDQPNKLQLHNANNGELILALTNENMFWRTTAQRLLVEKSDVTVLPELYKIVNNKKTDEIGINAGAIHALWTIHGLGALNGTNKAAQDVATNALKHPSGGVRKAAIEVLRGTPILTTALEKNKLYADKDFRVRLAAILSTIDMRTSPALSKIIRDLGEQPENKNDKWLALALELAGRKHIPANKMTTTAAKTNPGTKRKIDKSIVVNVLKDVMKFDKELITAKAGSTIEIILNNPDFMQHNLVLIKPGTSNKVGAAADAMARDADGAKKNYVPDMPEVLQSTPLLNPREKFTLVFKVPDTPGDYPFLCTFPGHWRIMNGTLRVTK